MRRFVWIALVTLLATGCGYGHLQTARPTPAGQIDLTVGAGYVHNKTIEIRKKDSDGGSGLSITNLPLMINSRIGLTNRVDLGLRLFFMAGAQVDAKVNLLGPRSPWALAVLAGLGAARDIGTKKGYLVSLPISLLASYDFSFGFTPYAAIGYSFFWIHGREEEAPTRVTYSDRKGYGDHLFTAAVGIKLNLDRRSAVFLEYNLWHPVVDDPGDFFSFTTSHIVILGLRVRGELFRMLRNYRPRGLRSLFPTSPATVPLPGSLPPPPPDGPSPPPPPPPPPPPNP